jgi:endonuclease YncB( thermonuclease family)
MRALAGFALAAIIIVSSAVAETVHGVPRVRDGDSLVVGGRQIRLAYIDAPEMRQSAGRYSLAARDVTCTGDDVDRYGRLVAICTVSGRSINLWLVSRGLAFAYWPFRRPVDLTRAPCPDESWPECRRTTPEMVAAEDAARRARRGVWHFDPLPVYPWCVRHAGGVPCRGPQ